MLLNGCRISDVRFLPIVSAFVNKIGLVDEVNRLCPGDMDVSAGHVVLALILDTLSGRSPLYRLEQTFQKMDLELLLGVDIAPSKLNDDAIGRVLERLSQAGTGKILTALAIRAVKLFDLETWRVHHDTTSVTVFGDYDLYEAPHRAQPFVITYGFSKDHRPDLKQFVHSLLCVDHGIPVSSTIENGNKSDKVINNNVLTHIADTMRALGERDFVYTADSALVTKENLDLMSNAERGCRFVTRLGGTYNECDRAIETAVAVDRWTDAGILARHRATPKRPSAHYRYFETTVVLYEREYRALVFHSSAHDKRKRKKLERQMNQDLDGMTEVKTQQEKIEYACLPDAKAALSRLPQGRFHRLTGRVLEVPKYGRGRPRKDGPRKPKKIIYRLEVEIQPKQEATAKAEQAAGCFVLLTNAPATGDGAVAAKDLLDTYKAQDSVERNFGFLKDDVIVNSLFLKSPARIEALGLVLVLALLVWRLMERTMRVTLIETGTTITGWERRQTSLPTSLMLTTRFPSVIVMRTEQRRSLAEPLNEVQYEYLRALGLSAEIFTRPFGEPARTDHGDLESWETTG